MSILNKIFPCLKKSNYGKIITTRGVTINLSKLSKNLTLDIIQNLEQQLIDFWMTKMGWSRNNISNCLSGIFIKMIDKETLKVATPNGDILAYGYTLLDTKEIFLAISPGKRNITSDKLIESLFKHEVSHVIVAYMDNQYSDQEKSHQLFKDKNLGA